MPKPPTILTVTMNPTVDICLEVDHLHGEGKNRAHVRSVQGGGGGINVARCVARLGGSALALHTYGGETGLRLERLLAEEGLVHRGIEIGAETREAVVIAELSSGHSFHIVPPGAELAATDRACLFDAILAAAHQFPYLVLTGSVPPGLPDDFCARLLRNIDSSRTRVVLDIAGPQLREVLREKAFAIRLDRCAAAGLLGRPIERFENAQAVNDLLLAAGATEIAITTVGALGAVYSNAAFHHRICAPSSPFRSDACAGDSLVGAFTYRLAASGDGLHACEYGVAAAAATVSRPGTDVFEATTVDALLDEVHTDSIARGITADAASASRFQLD
ncbi:1-phosphofructokinase family hexose kinase [Nocardia sp. CS682]|uniref:1-phosphofructokinase family hexose kinase n=1 Tax=Nocardia sp. CS682 TaxID=1047172 RepID=UPI001075611D|nr:PfkB family carbohydrate kinase [Nocardia sp. CS682]QBS45324.1 1-phosphofructokinase [Nocardia sp. CS682]